MSPTYDEEGRPASSRTVRFAPPLMITRVVVTHNAVSFFDADLEVLQVARQSYPGAGLLLDLDESVSLQDEPPDPKQVAAEEARKLGEAGPGW